MSGAEAASKIDTCASCGIAEGDDVKLKDCSACKLVKYCGTKCQKNHRLNHKRECKRRAAELRDELLFKQPESSFLGDCPICCLPLSLDVRKSALNTCCGKILCGGCHYANLKREAEQRLQQKCPFCRHPPPNSEEQLRLIQKRIEANDPVAKKEMGALCLIDREDHESAFKYLSKAAALGNASAHYHLARFFYHDGKFVEKDEKKELYHLEEAAIGGHADARYNLGFLEDCRRRYDRAAKHLVIAANMGQDEALEALKRMYRDGLVSKEDFASALRAHQAAVDATKSPQREEGEAYLRKKREEREHGG